jgi:heme/copper-type cytochrome/quinol oxidase subunit 2
VNRRLALLALVALALLLAGVPDASACAACFGKSDSKLAEGMNAGIFALLGVICSVLVAIAGFFYFIVRRAAKHPLPVPVESLPYVETSNA